MVANNRISKFTCFIIAGLSLVGIVARAQISDPPLLPGEVHGKTQNGCGVVVKPKDIRLEDNDVEGTKKAISEMVWTGACTKGLAEGLGELGKANDVPRKAPPIGGLSRGREGPPPLKIWGYSSGRILPEKFDLSSEYGRFKVYQLGDRGISIPNDNDPYALRWEAVNTSPRMLLSPDGLGVMTVTESCFGDLTRFSGCDSNNNFLVYGVRTFNSTSSNSNFNAGRTWCPNPRTTVGCQALLQEKAGPIIASIKAFIAEVENKITEDKLKYAELGLPMEQRSTAKKLAVAAEAKKTAALAAIALVKDKEIALTEQQERDEADAKERAKIAQQKINADKAYTASLARMNAGELFALADKKRTAKEPDKAREAFRLIVTKFSTNPLSAVAAQEMLKLPAAAPETAIEPSSANVGAAKPTASSPSKKRDDGLEDMAGALGATKK